MERLLNELVLKLREAQGDNLLAVILYGSAAAGDHDSSFSDLNVFCLVERLGREDLAASESVVRWWRDRGNPSPLLMTPEEMRGSTDCFPIEFHDMLDRRRVLFGEDAVADLEIDDVFYRARVEYELRAKLLRLRQKAAGILSDRDLLLRLMEESISTFCVLGRHALRLAGRTAPWVKREVIAALGDAFGLDTRTFYTLLDLREGKLKPRQVESGALFEDYLHMITVLVAAVDRLER